MHVFIPVLPRVRTIVILLTHEICIVFPMANAVVESDKILSNSSIFNAYSSPGNASKALIFIILLLNELHKTSLFSILEIANCLLREALILVEFISLMALQGLMHVMGVPKRDFPTPWNLIVIDFKILFVVVIRLLTRLKF